VRYQYSSVKLLSLNADINKEGEPIVGSPEAGIVEERRISAELREKLRNRQTTPVLF